MKSFFFFSFPKKLFFNVLHFFLFTIVLFLCIKIYFRLFFHKKNMKIVNCLVLNKRKKNLKTQNISSPYFLINLF